MNVILSSLVYLLVCLLLDKEEIKVMFVLLDLNHIILLLDEGIKKRVNFSDNSPNSSAKINFLSKFFFNQN